MGRIADAELVDSAHPDCGERDPDLLIWQDDDTVRYFGCGTTYQPGHPGK